MFSLVNDVHIGREVMYCAFWSEIVWKTLKFQIIPPSLKIMFIRAGTLENHLEIASYFKYIFT